MAMVIGGEAIIEILRCEGAECVFGLPASSELLFMDALEGYP